MTARIHAIIDKLHSDGMTNYGIAKKLNEKGIKTKGGANWQYSSVKVVLTRHKKWRVGPLVPFGYDLAENGVDYIKNLQEQGVIELIKSMRYFEDMRYCDIVRELAKLGHKNKQGKPIGRDLITRLLQRPEHCVDCGSHELLTGKKRCNACNDAFLSHYLNNEWYKKG